METPNSGFDSEVTAPGVQDASTASSAGSLGRRLSLGTWAVADQALFAGANFILNIVMARWLDPPTYGALAVGLAVLFLLGSMHVALLGEPLLVFGAGKFAHQRGAYLGSVFIGHWIVAGAVLILMVCAGGVFMAAGSRQLGIALLGLGFGSPLILLLWLARRACYLIGAPRRAAMAGLVYLVLMVALLACLRAVDMVSLAWALLVVGLCSGISGAALAWELRPSAASPDRSFLREVAGEHAAYGRWSATTNLVIFLSAQAIIVLVAGMLGLEASGQLRAILNLITPMHLVIAALVTLLVPALARAKGSAARAAIMRSMLLLAGGAVVYALLLGLLQSPLFRLLYGQQYEPAPHLVWLLAATLLPAAIADVCAAALRARQRPDLVLRGYAFAAAITIVGGVLLTLWLELTGAVVAMTLSSIASATVLWIHAVRAHSPRESPKRVPVETPRPIADNHA